MIPIKDLLNKIKWDKKEEPSDYTIVYKDRIENKYKEIKYSEIKGLSREAIEKLENIKPISLGQASRISGITPAAISALMVYIKVKYENSKLKAGQQIL